jgi:hypothetical protein
MKATTNRRLEKIGPFSRHGLDVGFVTLAHGSGTPAKTSPAKHQLRVNSRHGRAASKPGHARYAVESGSKFRAASQLMHLVKVARA